MSVGSGNQAGNMHRLCQFGIHVFFIAIVIHTRGWGQEVVVKDVETGNPVSEVIVKWKEKGLLTDEYGKVDLRKFGVVDTLIFHHKAYDKINLHFRDITDSVTTIWLTPREFDLSEIIISVNRWEQKKNDLPYKISRITQTEIQIQQPQTTADLIGATGEIFIQKSQLGGGSPMIRGFAANRVLLVVDDVRMNNAIFRSGNLQNILSLDPHVISSAEVIYGPGSVIYGSDALGGVMDFRTLKPQYSSNDDLNINANAFVRYATANTERTSHLDVNISKQKWSWLGSISYSAFDDLTMGRNGRDAYLRREYVSRINNIDSIVTNDDPLTQRFSGYDQWSTLQKLRIRTGNFMDWEYSFHFSQTSDVPRYDRLIEWEGDQPGVAEWFYGPQKWQMHALGMHYTAQTPVFDQFKVKLAYQAFEESRNDRSFGDPWLRTRVENVDALSATWDFTKNVSPTLRLFYGGEVLANWIASRGWERDVTSEDLRPVASRYPNGSTWASSALYSSIQHELGSRWKFSFGLRYNFIAFEAPFEDTFFDFPFEVIRDNTGALNGSLGAVYTPFSQWRISINASTGFRAPNIDDIGKVFDSEPGNVLVPNPQLGAEYAYNLDLSLRYSFWEGSQFEVTGFYTWLDNAIVRRDFTFNGQDSIIYDGELSRVQALVNAENASIYGIQLSLTAQLKPWLNLDSRFTWSRGEDQEGMAVRHVAPTFGATHLQLEVKQLLADFYTTYNGAIPYERLAPSERSKPFIYAEDEDGNPFSPDWYTLNFKANYRFSDHLSLSLGIENITDQRYRPYSSGIVAPGRNYIISLSGSI